MLDSLFELLTDNEPEACVAFGGSAATPADARAIRAKVVAAAFGPVAERSEFVEATIRLAGRR